MTPRQLEHYRDLLETERTRIMNALTRIAAQSAVSGRAEPGGDGIAGRFGSTPDDDDAVAAREMAALREVDDALRQLRDEPETYGMCARCGRPIPAERLEVVPATRICGPARST